MKNCYIYLLLKINNVIYSKNRIELYTLNGQVVWDMNHISLKLFFFFFLSKSTVTALGLGHLTVGPWEESQTPTRRWLFLPPLTM